MMKRILILGSTGTIGLNALKVVERFPDKFKIAGLTAFNNIDLLVQQVHRFKPDHVAVSPSKYDELVRRLNGHHIKIWKNDEICELCSLKEVDIVVIGISGRAALEPFLRAAQAGKTIAPANKEALVIAGDIIMKEARASGAVIIPVDSEQSAVFQCLQGNRREDLKKVYLTASGGALKSVPASQFNELTVEKILDHPRWKMGRKITVDSATMMNKGFEVIEAQRLFDLALEEIEILVHPEAIVHSMVCFKDGSVIAQLGKTDMRIPIQYALTYPERWESSLDDLDFCELAKLNFEPPDFKRFPSLGLALETAREGGSMPCVLNAADEVAVEAFLAGKIYFNDIYAVTERVVAQHKKEGAVTIEDILRIDERARMMAEEEVLNVLNRQGMLP
ncbi:MAG: 1-deoxy-D-xylulose-5-phosphate reductoisomerase [Candidatus Omnitrophota bacterium]